MRGPGSRNGGFDPREMPCSLQSIIIQNSRWIANDRTAWMEFISAKGQVVCLVKGFMAVVVVTVVAASVTVQPVFQGSDGVGWLSLTLTPPGTRWIRSGSSAALLDDGGWHGNFTTTLQWQSAERRLMLACRTVSCGVDASASSGDGFFLSSLSLLFSYSPLLLPSLSFSLFASPSPTPSPTPLVVFFSAKSQDVPRPPPLSTSRCL
jgi:hypothetical protein